MTNTAPKIEEKSTAFSSGMMNTASKHTFRPETRRGLGFRATWSPELPQSESGTSGQKWGKIDDLHFDSG